MAQQRIPVIHVPVPAPRRLPRLPWKRIALWGLVLVTAGMIAYGVFQLVSTSRDNPVAVPQPQDQPFAAPVVDPPAQIDPANSVAPPKVTDYEVTWTEVRGFNPSTIPVEEGFYRGMPPDSISWSPSNPSDIPEGDAFIWRVFPQLQEMGRGALVAAAKAPTDKSVVLASITAVSRTPPSLVLSVDGEKSWCRLNLLWAGVPYGEAAEVRAIVAGNEIRLYGKDPTPAERWWTAVVSRSELPCS